MRYYAGIGSRKTPPWVCELMTDIARRMEERGWHLRSGAAEGADTAFAVGTSPENRTIYVPWEGYRCDRRNLPVVVAEKMPNWRQALAMAQDHHPAWHRCSQGARALLARNCYQILGDDLNTPVECVIACTGKAWGSSGGTEQALRVAGSLRPVPFMFDLASRSVVELFQSGWLPE